MRNIKFRAWDKEHERMFNVLEVYYEDDKIFAWREPYKSEGVDWSRAGFEIGKECDLMQYTGLEDKNGKGIYEGDILTEYYDGNPDALEVYFEDGCFMVKQINSPNADHALNGCDLENTCVIGNVFENANLINK